MPALGSLEDLTPTIMRAISAKKHVKMKQIRYTAKYPTALSQSITTDSGKYEPVPLEQNGT